MHAFPHSSVRRFALFAAVPLLAACSWLGCVGQDPAPTSTPLPNQSSIASGERGGQCFPNKTCNEGLVCLDDLCLTKPVTGVPVTDAGAPSVADASADADGGFTCKKSGVTFTPPAIAPPAPKKLACNEAQIATIADACYTSPDSAACAAVRAQNPSCADCAFGSIVDAQWKPIVFTNVVPGYFYNTAGCVDRETGIPDCGKRYTTVVACFNFYCSGCAEVPEIECQKDVAQGSGECKSYLIDATCGSALDTVEKKCFPADNTNASVKTQFISLVTLACG